MRHALTTGVLGLSLVMAGATAPAVAATTGADQDPAPADQLRVAGDQGADGAGGSGQDYIVTVAPGVRIATALAGESGVTNLSGPAFHGAVVTLTPSDAASLEQAPGVEAVEKDLVMSVAAEDGGTGRTAAAATSWGLDRTDQATLPLDGDYSPLTDGAGVHEYVIDSGIDPDNPEFAGRMGNGAYAVGGSVTDCNGHGTHVAGTIGSSVYGMAKQVTIHPVRVFDCTGTGPMSNVVAAMNWVAANVQPHAVVNMSLTGGTSPAVNSAAANLVARGVVVAVAAGNVSGNACDYSPASEPSLLTVSAVDATDSDTDFSNYGACVDLYGPGTDIRSTDYLRSPSGRVMSGTSMATPHVAGAAATYWAAHPAASGPAVSQAIMDQATRNVIAFPYGQAGSPNVNLNVDWTTVTSEPQNLVATAGNRTAALTWTAPAFLGGAAVTGYRIEQRVGAGDWTVAVAANDGSLSGSFTGLTNGAAYQYRVAALNAVGMSGYAISGQVTPTAPPPPGVVTRTVSKVKAATKGKRTKLTWTAPANATSFRVRLTKGSKAQRTWHLVSKAKVTYKGLKHGKHKAQIVAVGPNGSSAVLTVTFRVKKH